MKYELATTTIGDGSWSVANGHGRHLGKIVRRVSGRNGRIYLLFEAACGIEQGDLRRLHHLMGQLTQELELVGVDVK